MIKNPDVYRMGYQSARLCLDRIEEEIEKAGGCSPEVWEATMDASKKLLQVFDHLVNGYPLDKEP